jgi:hypothetical protein
LESYDVIIVDIFSGDAGAVVRDSKGLFEAIAQSSINGQHHQQVVVANYFGIQGYQLHALYETIRQSFGNVRVYREETDDAVISNFVIVASHSGTAGAADAAGAALSGLLKTAPYSEVFADYKDHITDVLERREIVPTSTCGVATSLLALVRQRACRLREALATSGAHFRAMRGQFYI